MPENPGGRERLVAGNPWQGLALKGSIALLLLGVAVGVSAVSATRDQFGWVLSAGLLGLIGRGNPPGCRLNWGAPLSLGALVWAGPDIAVAAALAAWAAHVLIVCVQPVSCTLNGVIASAASLWAASFTLGRIRGDSVEAYVLAFSGAALVFLLLRAAPALVRTALGVSEARQILAKEGRAWIGGLPLLVFASPAIGAPLWLVGIAYVGSMAVVWQAQRVESVSRQITGLEHLSRRQLLTSDEGEILREFCKLLRELFAPHFVRVWGYDETGQRLGVVAGEPSRNPMRVVGEGIIGRSAQRGRVIVTPNAAGDARATDEERVQAMLAAFPIAVHGRLVGVVEMQMPRSGGFGRTQIGQLSGLCGHLAVILENIRLHHRLHAAATTDGLTGLLNHRRFQEALREELARAYRYRHPVSLLMADVDNFKQYNDRFGHPQGDALLRDIAAAIRDSIRAVDVPARYGGEEFAVLLPETGQESAEVIAERIRSLVASRPFEAGEDEPLLIRQTVSIGVATYPDHATDASGLLSLADKALYLAKDRGKNRISTAGEVIAAEHQQTTS